jgi:hypothetical protein
MKLIDALANFDQTDRLTDGMQIWHAGDLASDVAEADDREYDLLYLHDGRVALYRISDNGTRYPQPSYVEVQ